MSVEQEIDLLTGVEGSFTNDDASEQESEAESPEEAQAEPLPAGMSLVGLGVDIVEISRMEDILKRTPSFKQRVFTEDERAYCESKHNPAVHYALFFAAKEAVLKALGTGFRGMGINDVQVGHNRYGRPLAILAGNAARVAEEQGIHEVHLSLSYTHTTGVASAVAARKEDIPEQRRADEAQVALDQQFKSMRAMLEDIDAKLTEIEGTAKSGQGKLNLEMAEEAEPTQAETPAEAEPTQTETPAEPEPEAAESLEDQPEEDEIQ